jgi:acyl-CoA thioesterase
MNSNSLATRITKHMMQNDPFSTWLGIECEEVSEGHCVLRLKVRAEMLNGFGILHGGIAFSLADSALAFAANGRGIQALSVHNNIDYLQPCRKGDELLAIASEESLNAKFGRYKVIVHNQEGSPVALFHGMVYLTHKKWEI